MCLLCFINLPERITLPPDYNPKAKKENKLYDVRRVSEICPVRPPTEELVGTLAEEWGGGSQSSGAMSVSPTENMEQLSVLEHPKMTQIRKGSNGKN